MGMTIEDVVMGGGRKRCIFLKVKKFSVEYCHVRQPSMIPIKINDRSQDIVDPNDGDVWAIRPSPLKINIDLFVCS